MIWKKEKKERSRQLLGTVVLYLFFIGPAIDVLTYITAKSLIITPGMIVRVSVLLVAIFYLCFIDIARRKLNVMLLAILLVIIIGVFINNMDYVRALDFQFFNYVFKYVYLCIGLMYCFSYFQTQRTSFNTYLYRIPLSIITIVFFLSFITKTAHPTYETWGYGFSGWFNSPNEIGILLCCIFPVALFNAFNDNQKKGLLFKTIDIMLVICISIIMLSIGTKAPLVGFIATSSIYFVYRIITIRTNHFHLSLIVLPVLLVISLIMWNSLPAVANTNLRMEKIQSMSLKIKKQNDKAKTQSSLRKNANSDNSYVEGETAALILNGRDDFEKAIIKYRSDDGTTNHALRLLFGRFYSNKNDILIVERDFHDIFYLFGLVGLLFVLILLFPIIIAAVIHFIFAFMNKSSQLSFSLLVSVGITIMAAFIGGHALLSPSVASFFMISFSLLLRPSLGKRSVMFVASAGGHLTQIMRLKPIFEDYYSYLVTEKTPIKITTSIPTLYVLYCSRKQRFSYLVKASFNTLRSFWIFARINPDAIVTTGSHTAVPFCLYGFLFHKKVIYIESFAKSSSPTMTGRIIYPLADTFIIQWKGMKKFYPKAKYFGGIY